MPISQVCDQTDLCHTPWLCTISEFAGHFAGIPKQTLSMLLTEQRLHSCDLLVLQLIFLPRLLSACRIIWRHVHHSFLQVVIIFSLLTSENKV